MVEDIEETISIMQELTAAGVRFAIDDFGMGYSSLRYLKSLPLHTIKIDQSFIRDVLTDPSDASIVRAILSMSHALDLDIIAEGVEHEEVHDFLVEEGCIMFQGYLYSRPVPLEDFHRLLKNENLSRAVGM
jgi:EAL domain-containing protein (putative c-di-GMP-specific phosphodiesterase class I)